MFTGIVETIATIKNLKKEQNNIVLTIESNISKQLKTNQSISHNGVCLTVESVYKNTYKVTLISETILKTNFNENYLDINIPVNLERCLKISDRLDGHFLQGHVDCIAKIKDISNKNGSYNYVLEFFNKEFNKLVVEKGSVAVNGISLTCFNVKDREFTVSIIPHTYKLTNISKLNINNFVNIEFDILGKYILKNKNN